MSRDIRRTRDAKECCCEVVCLAPTLDFRARSLSRNVCGFLELQHDVFLTPPVVPLKKYSKRDVVSSFDHSWTFSNGADFTESFVKTFVHTVSREHGKISPCVVALREHGEGVVVYNSTLDKGTRKVFGGCGGNGPTDQPDSRVVSATVGFSIDTDVAPGRVVTGDIVTTQGKADENFDCGSYVVRGLWDGTTVTTTAPAFYGAFDGDFNQSDGVLPTVDNVYSELVVWADVEAALEAVFDDEAVVDERSFSGIIRTGDMYNGIAYNDVPVKIEKVEAEVRFKVPSLFEGSYYKVRYDFLVTPYNEEEGAFYMPGGSVEWAGPGVVDDAESWYTEWVELPVSEVGVVTIRAVAYKCYRSGFWTKF